MEYLLNIPSILVGLIVIKLLIPFIFFKLLHSLNILDMSVTLIVSKFDKSKYSKFLHLLNIPSILVGLIVIKLLIPFNS